ncbi:hypothetical protein ACIBCD_14965 [Nocardia brasiliensis]|uniref:hypothetical protein n=1 Tax=Nocardia brasiliensis TaxID=37326 RepID=UPI003789DEA0
MTDSADGFVIRPQPRAAESTTVYTGPGPLLIVGHTTTSAYQSPCPGTTVESFPGLTLPDWDRTFLRPVVLTIRSGAKALSLNYDGTLARTDPPPAAQVPMMARRDFGPSPTCADLLPVWFHEPSNRFVLAPYQQDAQSVQVEMPAAVLAHLPHAPAIISTIYPPRFE